MWLFILEHRHTQMRISLMHAYLNIFISIPKFSLSQSYDSTFSLVFLFDFLDLKAFWYSYICMYIMYCDHIHSLLLPFLFFPFLFLLPSFVQLVLLFFWLISLIRVPCMSLVRGPLKDECAVYPWLKHWRN